MRTLISLILVAAHTAYGCGVGQKVAALHNGAWEAAIVREELPDQILLLQFLTNTELCMDSQSDYFGTTAANRPCLRRKDVVKPFGSEEYCAVSGVTKAEEDQASVERKRWQVFLGVMAFMGCATALVAFNWFLYKWCVPPHDPNAIHDIENPMANLSPHASKRSSPKTFGMTGMSRAKNMVMLSPNGRKIAGMFSQKDIGVQEKSKWGGRNLNLSFSWTPASPMARRARAAGKTSPESPKGRSLWELARREVTSHTEWFPQRPTKALAAPTVGLPQKVERPSALPSARSGAGSDQIPTQWERQKSFEAALGLNGQRDTWRSKRSSSGKGGVHGLQIAVPSDRPLQPGDFTNEVPVEDSPV